MNIDVNPIFVIVILGGIMLAGIFLLKAVRKIPALGFSLILLYIIVTILTSLIYLENFEAFINEASRTSEWIGATYRFAFFNIVLLAGLVLSLTYKARRPRTIVQPERFDLIASSVIVMAIILIELANLALSRSTAFPFGNATRFDYWEQYAFAPFLAVVPGVLILFIPFMATSLAIYAIESHRRGLWYAMIASIVGYFIYLFGTGQVFNGYLLPASIIFGIYMIWKSIRGKQIIRPKIAIIGLAFALLVSIVAVSDIGERAIGQGNGIEGSIYRLLVVQGGVIWEAVNLRLHGFEGNWRQLIDGGSFLIYAILPSGLAAQYDAGGVNLQGALPITVYLALGFLPATAISFVYGILCGAVMRLLLWMFVTGQVLFMLIGSYIWLWTNSAYSRGSLETIVTPQYVLAWVIAGIWALHRSQMIRRRRGAYRVVGFDPRAPSRRPVQPAGRF